MGMVMIPWQRAMSWVSSPARSPPNRMAVFCPCAAASCSLTAASLGLETRGVIDLADPSLPPAVYARSEWVVIGATSALTALPDRWHKVAPGGVILSDDRVDLLALLRR